MTEESSTYLNARVLYITVIRATLTEAGFIARKVELTQTLESEQQFTVDRLS